MYVAKRTRSGYSLYDSSYDTSQQEHRGLALLRELGCASAQGYYLSPPLAPIEFIG